MKQSFKNLLLIIGITCIIIGSSALFIEELSKRSALFGGGLFTVGVYLISKTLSKVHSRTRRDINIREIAKDRYANEEE